MFSPVNRFAVGMPFPASHLPITSPAGSGFSGVGAEDGSGAYNHRAMPTDHAPELEALANALEGVRAYL
jgi:hypothetical protein